MLRSRSALSRSARVVATTILLSSLGAAVSAPPAAASTDAGRLVHATNTARVRHDLHRYAERADLNSVARRWAAHMAAHHTLAHNPRLAREVRGWRQLGENVGVGGSALQIQRAFMHSSPHRANVLSQGFRQVGIGTARDRRGRLYVDVVFRRPC